MWEFFRPQSETIPLTIPTTNPTNNPVINVLETPNSTPMSTPVDETQIHVTHDNPTQPEQPPMTTTEPQTIQQNRPWGDIWDATHPQTHFRILSKNTGTINPDNMDMVALTKAAVTMGASIFAAQETNINWNPTTINTIYTQGKQQASHLFLQTSTSTETSDNWHKPGGTLLVALGKWTSRITTRGNDPILGRWSFMELVGKHNKRLIVISAYRVCNQQFDAASNTTSSQQTRLLQSQGIQNPHPRTIFLNDLISQINEWRRDNKEVILCMDANESVDDPRANISRLFRETDLIDLHYHRYPSLAKPATHQRGSKPIDLIAGSPLTASAMLKAWIHPFGDPALIKGDHRLLGVDFDTDILFGNAPAPMLQLNQRGVNSRHEQKVAKFCKTVISQCTRHQLAERIEDLQNQATLTAAHCKELERIDAQLTKILTQADRQCTPPNLASWSPELNQAYLRHRLWSLTYSAQRNERDLTDAITSIRQQLTPHPDDQNETRRSTSANLRHAQKALRKAKREADNLRKQHLNAILNKALASNERKKSKQLKHLISAEQNKRCYAAFRQHTKPKSSGGLSHVTKNNGPDQPPTIIIDREELDDTLLEYSRTHFAKAQGSPFTIEPLNRLLQYDGLTTLGNQVLQGRANLSQLPINEPTRAILTHLKSKIPATDRRPHPLDYGLLMEGIKKWPERTTTSPSGRHLGIYKSLRRHVKEKKKETDVPDAAIPGKIEQGRDVLYLIFDIMSLALQHTYTLERWKTVWTMFLEKDLGNPDINLLRCIMIFEADWQLLLKWHSSYGFLPRTEHAHTLTTDQGGGRKGRSTIDQALQLIAESELIRLNQRPTIDLFLDARHCFDLMVEACHNMACRRHGATEDYLRLHAQTHRLMKYYVRHKFGVSPDFNTFENHPWHGAGQGAADAALRYIVLSDTLIDAYHAHIQPSIIPDPTLTLTITKSIKAFIDDVAMSAIDPSDDIEILIARAQTQLQWWSQLIQATGGALNPKKCHAAIYTWTPDKHGILRLATRTNDDQIISDPNQPQERIQNLKPPDGTRYLGVYVTMNGSTKPMESHLWKKALLYTKAFQRTHMSRREANVLYRSCFVPALSYPLPATWLQLPFFERLHRLSTSTILNKMGYHRFLPRAMVFAPRTLGGVGLCHLYHEQCAQQIMILLRHLRAKSSLGKTLEILVRTYQLWAGMPQSVLINTEKLSWIPDHWLTKVRAAMNEYDIQIRYDAWTVKPMRHHDRFLMEDFIQQDFSKHQLEQLNACRMYLNVTTLAEITDHTGTELLPQILSTPINPIPKGLVNISKSTLQWPRIHNPSAHCWRMWTRSLCNLYAGSSKNTRLTTPLGNWTTHYQDIRFWHWRMNPNEQLLFQHTPTAATRSALPVLRRRNLIKFSPTIPSPTPFTGPPITPIDPTTGYVRLPIAQVASSTQAQAAPVAYRTLQQQFRVKLKPWQKPLFGSLRKLGPTYTLHNALHTQQQVYIVSDASVQKCGHSSFAWVISQQATILWWGQGLAPGPADDMHSGRAEAFGLLAALLFMQDYIRCYDPLPIDTTINCFCDNIGVITTIKSMQNDNIPRPNDTTNDNRDLYTAIMATISACHQLVLQFHHVKGHQDEKANRPLTIEEILNIECDQLAKQYAKNSSIKSTTLDNPEIEEIQPHLRIAGKTICRHFLPALREAAATPAYRKYLCTKLEWMPSDANNVNWTAFKYALTSFPRNDQRRLVLFINDKLPLRASKAHPHPGSQLCPSCKREPENAWHFLECSHTERRREFTSLKQNLTQFATTNSLHPCLFTAIWLGLLAIRNDTDYPDVNNELPPIIRRAVQAQHRIGWDQLYQGRFSIYWAQAIDKLHPSLASSGRLVTTQMIQIIWNYVLATWTLRNQHLHQDGGQLSLPDYRQAVLTMYEQRHQLPPAAQDAIFNRPIEQIMDQSPAKLRTWIIRTNAYMKQQLRAAKARAKINTHDIRSFFGPVTATNDLQPP